jgi:hypothetical protein
VAAAGTLEEMSHKERAIKKKIQKNSKNATEKGGKQRQSDAVQIVHII